MTLCNNLLRSIFEGGRIFERLGSTVVRVITACTTVMTQLKGADHVQCI